LVAISVLGVTACFGDDNSGDAIPIVQGATSRPGTLLGDGFRVPPGALLVGAPLPKFSRDPFFSPRSEPSEDNDRGWRAWLIVPGDARATWHSLAEQVERSGIPIIETWCSSEGSNPGDYMVCAIVGADFRNGRQRIVSIYLRRGALTKTDGGPKLVSHITLGYSDFAADSAVSFREDTSLDNPGTIDRRVPAVPTTWPKLAEPDDALNLGRYLRLRVERGSRLAAPLWDSGCAGGNTAILAIDGDPETVMRGYQAQMEAQSGLLEPLRERRDGPTTIFELGGYADGEYRLHLIRTPELPNALVIEHCPET
jgi:hypothetical protein